MYYGDRIRLRAIERTDIPTFVRWFNDPDVRRNLLIFAPMSRAEEERWFENRLQMKDDYLYAIEAHVDGEWVHIGNTGLHGIRWQDRSATFGIAIGEKDFWGKGYGTDATRTIVRFGFDELNLYRIELEVFEDNPRAIRAYEKAGFVREGVRRQSHYSEGRYKDSFWMSILREEYLAQKRPG